MSATRITQADYSDPFQIKAADVRITNKELGRGATSKVYLGTLKGNVVAIKQITYRDNNIEFCERERQLLQKLTTLNAPNVVNLHGYFVNELERTYNIVMEFVPTTLYKFLRANGRTPFATTRAIMINLATSLAFLHRHHIIHRDIKLQNVLLNVDLSTKLCDFGIAIDFSKQKNNMLKYEIGSSYFKRPSATPDVTIAKSDIYKLGLIMFTMATGKAAFHLFTPACNRNIPGRENGNVIPINKEYCPPKFATLIKQCCSEDPNQRPTAEEIVSTLKDENILASRRAKL